MLEEIDTLRAQGVAVSPDNLKIAHNATLILPLHQELDAVREGANSGVKIGTTKRGIGPAYEDKVGRRALRVADLADPDTLADKIDHLLRHHNTLRRGLDLPPYDAAALLEKLKAVAPEITPYAAPVWRLLNEARRAGKRILFEGAKACFWTLTTAPILYVTSSNTIAGQAAIGTGIGPSALTHVLGITKAYTTRWARGRSPPSRKMR